MNGNPLSSTYQHERKITMRKKTAFRFTASALAVAALPFAVSKAVQNPPDMDKLVAAAVNFTSESSYSSETAEIGNGNLILYKPLPQQSAIITEPAVSEYEKAQPSSITDPAAVEYEKEQPTLIADPAVSEYEKEQPSDTSAAATEAGIAEPTAAETEPAYQQSGTAEENVSDTAPLPLTPEGMSDIDMYMITQNISSDREDLSVFNSRDLLVEHMTFEPNNGENFLQLPMGGQVRNCTELENDFLRSEMVLPSDIAIEAYSDQPQVLIIHTHACESYLTGDGEYQDESYTCRTTDPSQSVVAVGQRIAEKLAQNGICVIHDGSLHDYPSYNGSYGRAEETIRSILDTYPSVKAVLDIHRDGIVEEDGSPVAAVTEINGKKAAQVMIISAASDGYYYVPNYLDNFHFACLLQQHMESENPGITRPVLLEYCQYNQHITTGSLLIEVGSQGNTLEQALYSGELIGESIAKALLTLCR